MFERKRRESIKEDTMTSCPRTPPLEVPAQVIRLCHITQNQKDIKKSALQNSLAAPLGCFSGIVSISNVHTRVDEFLTCLRIHTEQASYRTSNYRQQQHYSLLSLLAIQFQNHWLNLWNLKSNRVLDLARSSHRSMPQHLSSQ